MSELLFKQYEKQLIDKDVIIMQLETDHTRLLVVARAAKKIKERGHHWSVDGQTSILHIPPDETRELRTALAAVEDLL